MLTALLTTGNVWTLTLLRVALGVVIFPHGAQKALGWFGGYGIKPTMGFLTQNVGLPSPIAGLVIAAEFLGSLGLIFGAFGRVAAFGVLAVMIGAVVTSHLKVGFFMNWGNTPDRGEGYEYHILAIAMAVTVIVSGSGALSLDRLLIGQ